MRTHSYSYTHTPTHLLTFAWSPSSILLLGFYSLTTRHSVWSCGQAVSYCAAVWCCLQFSSLPFFLTALGFYKCPIKKVFKSGCWSITGFIIATQYSEFQCHLKLICTAALSAVIVWTKLYDLSIPPLSLLWSNTQLIFSTCVCSTSCQRVDQKKHRIPQTTQMLNLCLWMTSSSVNCSPSLCQRAHCQVRLFC